MSFIPRTLIKHHHRQLHQSHLQHLRPIVRYLKRPAFKAPSKPSLQLPAGYTFYPNHNDIPVPPVPAMARIYESEHPPPHLPRTSVFHYIFPPERKGRPPRYYPQPVPQSVAFIDGVTGRKLMRDEIPVHAMWLNSGLLAMGLKKGDVACIFGTNSLDWVEACFACQALGAIVSPANYG